MNDRIPKDPDAILPYTFNWEEWLDGLAVIQDSLFTISPASDELISDLETFDNLTATIWLSGGTPGKMYRVSNKIETDSGLVDERSITIICVER